MLSSKQKQQCKRDNTCLVCSNISSADYDTILTFNSFTKPTLSEHFKKPMYCVGLSCTKELICSYCMVVLNVPDGRCLYYNSYGQACKESWTEQQVSCGLGQS